MKVPPDQKKKKKNLKVPSTENTRGDCLDQTKSFIYYHSIILLLFQDSLWGFIKNL